VKQDLVAEIAAATEKLFVVSNTVERCPAQTVAVLT
jgi:hypothetical protein